MATRRLRFTPRLRIEDATFRRRLDAMGGKPMLDGMSLHLFRAAHLILNRSQPLVPYDPDRTAPGPHLNQTGRVLQPKTSVAAKRTRVEMFYGDAAHAYSVPQHERLDFNHPWPGTQAKYLEQPFGEERPKTLIQMRNDINTELRRIAKS